jgi:hypothetical protein
MATNLFVHIANQFIRVPRPPMGDSFEEWLFWHTPSHKHFRSARQGVAELDVPSPKPIFDLALWQSLLEHSDLVIEEGSVRLGVECKSLEASPNFISTGNGVPCRTTIDFNSTVPCGQENFKGKFQPYRELRGKPLRTFYALALYGEVGGENKVLSFILADGNYLNRDYKLHQEHKNISRPGFGSYGDGQIRERKMYIFPNPLTDDDLKGTISLVSENSKLIQDFPDLVPVMTKIKRSSSGTKYPFYVYRLKAAESKIKTKL